jgi:hypothetical protein
VTEIYPPFLRDRASRLFRPRSRIDPKKRCNFFGWRVSERQQRQIGGSLTAS